MNNLVAIDIFHTTSVGGSGLGFTVFKSLIRTKKNGFAPLDKNCGPFF